MNRTLKNHYITRFQLGKFSNTSDILFGYDKIQDKTIFQKSENFGYEKYLYSQDLEELLGKYDTEFSHAISNFEKALTDKDNIESIKTEDIGRIASFLAVQLNRTPKAKENVGKIVATLNSQNPLYNEPFGRKLLEEVFDKQESFQNLIFDTSSSLFKILMDYKWFIIAAPEDYSFITSDTGSAIAAKSLKGTNAQGLGLTSPDSLKVFPLTKKYCLVITSETGGPFTVRNGRSGIEFREFSKEQVHHLNGIIFSCAHRWVYAENKQLLIEAKEEAENIFEKTTKMLNEKDITNE